ncbi:hypothetical protein EVAR_78679_1 [Eumeta japonica]|uniref:Uncharacterized protein n=1 Tax=Eumeta variegata TaxID=151549 RepID=A0A4C1U829_EUMVA|nr:hypothetical protein EVAR_78679_1 [Eumeta japonica]
MTLRSRLQSMSRAVGTHTCCPAALGEAIEVVRPVARLYSIAHPISPTLPTRVRARGVCGIDIFYPLHVASGKQKKNESFGGLFPSFTSLPFSPTTRRRQIPIPTEEAGNALVAPLGYKYPWATVTKWSPAHHKRYESEHGRDDVVTATEMNFVERAALPAEVQSNKKDRLFNSFGAVAVHRNFPMHGTSYA